MASRFSGGHGTCLTFALVRLAAIRGLSPLSSFTFAIQHVFGTKPDCRFTHSAICL